MEVRSGYKRSEMGVIPDDWRSSSMGDEAELLTGFPFPSSEFSKSGVRLLRGSNVKRGNVDWSPDITQHWCAIDAKTKPYELRIGDLVIAMDGALVGRSFATITALDLPALLVQRVARLRSKRSIQDLLRAWVASDFFVRHVDLVKTHTAIPHISPKDIREFALVVPADLSEQRAIAKALSDVDALLSGMDQLIAKKRDIKQAAMQQLLTGQTRLPGFRGEWETKAIGDISTVKKGTQLHSSETSPDGHFPHFNGGIAPSSYTDKFNTTANTIAISEGGNSCGYVQLVPEPFWCGGHCYAVVPKSADNRFFFHALKGQQTAIQGLRVGSGLPNVQKSALADFELRLPSDKAEQAAIATILSDMDAELVALEARRDKTRALRQGMMQELLTGRTRLV